MRSVAWTLYAISCKHSFQNEHLLTSLLVLLHAAVRIFITLWGIRSLFSFFLYTAESYYTVFYQLTNEIENRTTSSLKVYNESFVPRWTSKPAKLLLGFVSTMEHWKGLDLAHALLFSIQRHFAELCLCTHILGEDKYGENLMLQINAKGNTIFRERITTPSQTWTYHCIKKKGRDMTREISKSNLKAKALITFCLAYRHPTELAHFTEAIKEKHVLANRLSFGLL